MKVLLRYSVECSCVLEALSVEAAIESTESMVFEDWDHDHGPVDGEDITPEPKAEPEP